jgi:hypothetical protein
MTKPLVHWVLSPGVSQSYSFAKIFVVRRQDFVATNSMSCRVPIQTLSTTKPFISDSEEEVDDAASCDSV